MNRILQRLIKIFSKGERLKTGRVIAQDLRYASELKKLANWETTSPEVYELWSLISKEQRVAYLREMKHGKLTAKELEQRLNKQLDRTASIHSLDFKIKEGIPFAAEELNEIDRITKKIQNAVNSRKKSIRITFTSDKFHKITKLFTDRIRTDIKSKTSHTGQVHQKLSGNPFEKAGTEISITLVSRDIAKQIRADYHNGIGGWKNSQNEVYIVLEPYTVSNFGGSLERQRVAIEHVLTHEISHVKDPLTSASLKTYGTPTYKQLPKADPSNPKSKKSYDPSAMFIPNAEYSLKKSSPRNYFKNYFYHQLEITANFSPILKLITTNTENIVKRIGKQKTIKALDEIAQWLATGTQSVGYLSSNALGILGNTSIYKKLLKLQDPGSIFSNPELSTIQGFYATFKQQNPAAYKQVINKTARQIEDLKQQVNRTRSLTPESIIEYKVLV